MLEDPHYFILNRNITSFEVLTNNIDGIYIPDSNYSNHEVRIPDHKSSSITK